MEKKWKREEEMRKEEEEQKRKRRKVEVEEGKEERMVDRANDLFKHMDKMKMWGIRKKTEGKERIFMAKSLENGKRRFKGMAEFVIRLVMNEEEERDYSPDQIRVVSLKNRIKEHKENIENERKLWVYKLLKHERIGNVIEINTEDIINVFPREKICFEFCGEKTHHDIFDLAEDCPFQCLRIGGHFKQSPNSVIVTPENIETFGFQFCVSLREKSKETKKI